MDGMLTSVPNKDDMIIQTPKGKTYVFVILHYLVEDLTKICVSSIFDLDAQGDTIKIVIVDNASPNESGALLEEYYADNDDVCIIRNAANLGFSAANNIGYSFARENWDPDAIIVLNNDIRIVQEDFLLVLAKVLEETSAHLVFPDVYAPTIDKHQSPLRSEPLSVEKVEREIEYNRCILERREYQRKTHPVKKALKRFAFIRYLAAVRRKRKEERIEAKRRERQYDVVPSGATLIFAKPFIETGEMPFMPETFLYYEEDILALRCIRNGWHTVYEPELQVLHFHRGATSKIVKTDEERERFIAKHFLDSLYVLLDCYETN